MRRWLSTLGLERYAEIFADNDIDESVLGELAEADLVALGITSLGHRKKLMAAIRKRGDWPSADAAPGGQTISLGGSSTPPEPPVLMTASLADTLAARGYAIVEQLGEGGMGNVLLARQQSVERNVAIKVLRGRAGGDGAVRFAREARAIAALTHPNSIRLYDFVVGDEGDAGIIMEYVEGQSLSALFNRERRLPFARAVDIVVKVCDALTEAHAKGIVHRDLKPANILLQDAHGYVDFPRVLDFGLARWLLVDESRLTRTGAVYGTPRYLSPEQIQGADVTLQSDLYSLGIVLYEALAGRPPFFASVEATLFYQHLQEPPPPLPADVPRPRGIDQLLERLLAKSPALRPASAHALRRELVALTRAEPSRASTSKSGKAAAILDVAPERRRVAVVDIELFGLTDAGGTDADKHARLGRCRAVADTVRRRHGAFRASVSGAIQTWVFGAPVAHRDDIRRALVAALDLCDALESVEGAAARVGVAAGVVVAGGTEWGREPLIVGGPLDDAAAFRERARVGEVLVAEDLPDDDDTTEASPTAGVVRLIAATPTSRSSSSSAALPFVGRAREIGEIESALDRCLRTRVGRMVVVAGEAGIGKSRLLDRVRPSAEQLGFRCARAVVCDGEVATQGDVMRQLVAELLGLPADPVARSTALEERIAEVELGPGHWPFLFHFLGVALSGPMQRVYDAIEPSARRAGYRDMLAALLTALSSASAVALMVEDLHWADAATLDSVETLCAIGAALPILLVFTTRVEGEERWRHCLVGQTVTRLELGPLDVAEADALARRLGAPEQRRTAAVARAGGHPLLLTEMIRGTQTAADALPPSIQGLVQARLDQLPERDRAAIQIASVLGPRGTLDELRDVLGDTEYDPALLTDYRLLERSDQRCAFVHALVRDAVYDSIVEDRRKALHQRCAPLARDAGQAARHLERAGSPHAAEAYLEAAKRAFAGDRYEEARALADRGVELAADPLRARLLECRGEAELSLGDVGAAEETHAAMAAVAEDDAQRYRAMVGRADALRLGGRPDEALVVLDEAEVHAARAGIEASRAFYLRGGVYFSQGELEGCRTAHERALQAARRDHDVELIARASSGLADALYGAGRIASALPAYEECLKRAEEAGLLGVEVLNLPMLAIVSVFMNDLERAETLATCSIARARELSNRRAETLGLGAASLAALHRGMYDEGARYGQAALVLLERSGSVVFEQTAHYYVARCFLGADQPARALAHVERGLALCRRHSMSFVGAALLATRARLVDDVSERAALIGEGARVVAARSLSFNRFWFRENAIEEALDRGDAGSMRAHALELEAATRDEPFPWAQHVVARALLLADHVEGNLDVSELGRLREAAQQAGLRLTIGPIVRALADASR